jgi:hypothetical protein
MPEKPEEKRAFVKPIETADSDKVEPIVIGNRKVYVAKLGYRMERNGKEVTYPKVNLTIASLNRDGDPVRRKQINFPVDWTQADFKKIFEAIMKVKDKELVA